MLSFEEFQDYCKEHLALIYKVLVSSEDAGTATITIHNDHLAFWDMTVEEVHELAMKNTRELLPVTVQSMNEVMREMFSRDGMDEEMLEALFEDRPADEQMFVISNESKVNGAASIFYEDVLTDLAAKMGTDLYVLPSSKQSIPCQVCHRMVLWDYDKMTGYRATAKRFAS